MVNVLLCPRGTLTATGPRPPCSSPRLISSPPQVPEKRHPLLMDAYASPPQVPPPVQASRGISSGRVPCHACLPDLTTSFLRHSKLAWRKSAVIILAKHGRRSWWQYSNLEPTTARSDSRASGRDLLQRPPRRSSSTRRRRRCLFAHQSADSISTIARRRYCSFLTQCRLRERADTSRRNTTLKRCSV